MSEKTKELKTASKVIAVMMKIGYIAMTVAMCACAAILIFMAATGGETEITTAKGTTIAVAEGIDMASGELAVLCAELLVMSGLLFAIFLIAYRMFNEISSTGDPFVRKYAKSVKTTGILIAAMAVAAGIADEIAANISMTAPLDAYTELPGLMVGAVVFCLAYIIDYGCEMKRTSGRA